ILKSVGREYTQQFLQGAQRQIDKMQRYFMVQSFEVEPDVYIKVTDNYIELTLRYVVDPKQRRKASSFIYAETFRKLRERDDIQIGSTTMDLTVHPPDAQAQGDDNTKKSDNPTAAVGKPSQLKDTQEKTAREMIGKEEGNENKAA